MPLFMTEVANYGWIGQLRGLMKDLFLFAHLDPGAFFVLAGIVCFLAPRLLKTWLTFRYDKLPSEHPAKAKHKPTYKITDMLRYPVNELLPLLLFVLGALILLSK